MTSYDLRRNTGDSEEKMNYTPLNTYVHNVLEYLDTYVLQVYIRFIRF